MGYLINISKWLSDKLLILGPKLNSATKRMASKIYEPKPTLKTIGWEKYIKQGGEQLRLDYELNEESILFDMGGYDGQFASDFYSKFLCNIYIFEAHKPFAENIKIRFKRNNKIRVFDYGLASEDGYLEISIDSVSSSTFKKTNEMATIALKKASEFINNQKISKIDLMKINIEGGEYDLLHHLIDSNKIQNIRNLQIQFHDFVPDALDKMYNVRALLSKTHQPTYLCDFIWENWSIK